MATCKASECQAFTSYFARRTGVGALSQQQMKTRFFTPLAAPRLCSFLLFAFSATARAALRSRSCYAISRGRDHDLEAGPWLRALADVREERRVGTASDSKTPRACRPKSHGWRSPARSRGLCGDVGHGGTALSLCTEVQWPHAGHPRVSPSPAISPEEREWEPSASNRWFRAESFRRVMVSSKLHVLVFVLYCFLCFVTAFVSLL